MEFLISRNGILDIKKSISWCQKNNISWYQEMDFLISRNDFLISGIRFFLYQEMCIISWYQEIEFLISRNAFLDIRMYFSIYRFASLYTSVLDFYLKNTQIISKPMTQGFRYRNLPETYGKFCRSHTLRYCLIWWNIVSSICFWRNLSSCLQRWSRLQHEEDHRQSEFHLVGLDNSSTSSASTVWPSDHRQEYRYI